MIFSLVLALMIAAQTAAPPVARFEALTANLKEGPGLVRIDILAWSNDADRSRLVDAWNLIAPATTVRGGAVARGTAGARGTRGTRGAPAAPVAAAAPVARDTPEKSLAAALQSAEGVGYLWTSESTGYSLRYAYRLVQPDGTERIILATDRRLGAWENSWIPAPGPAPDYGFTIIELRLNAKHEGEGKASLTGKVSVDGAANTIALDSYATLPVLLRNVSPRTTN